LIRKLKRIQEAEAWQDSDSDNEGTALPQSQHISSSDAEDAPLPQRHKREEISSMPMPSRAINSRHPNDEEGVDEL